MQIAITKLISDLSEYLSSHAALKPVAPPTIHRNGVRAVYSCETPEGVSYVRLDVTVGDALFKVDMTSSFALFQTQYCAQHIALLDKILVIKDFLLRRMTPCQPFDDRIQPTHRVSKWLIDAGIWLNSWSSSVFR